MISMHHPCMLQGHHLHGMQCSMAVFIHSLFILCVSWKWSLFFFVCVLHSSVVGFGSDFEVINGHGIEKKEVNSM
jgi:hypothetical protein